MDTSYKSKQSSTNHPSSTPLHLSLSNVRLDSSTGSNSKDDTQHASTILQQLEQSLKSRLPSMNSNRLKLKLEKGSPPLSDATSSVIHQPSSVIHHPSSTQQSLLNGGGNSSGSSVASNLSHPLSQLRTQSPVSSLRAGAPVSPLLIAQNSDLPFRPLSPVPQQSTSQSISQPQPIRFSPPLPPPRQPSALSTTPVLKELEAGLNKSIFNSKKLRPLPTSSDPLAGNSNDVSDASSYLAVNNTTQNNSRLSPVLRPSPQSTLSQLPSSKPQVLEPSNSAVRSRKVQFLGEEDGESLAVNNNNSPSLDAVSDLSSVEVASSTVNNNNGDLTKDIRRRDSIYSRLLNQTRGYVDDMVLRRQGPLTGSTSTQSASTVIDHETDVETPFMDAEPFTEALPTSQNAGMYPAQSTGRSHATMPGYPAPLVPPLTDEMKEYINSYVSSCITNHRQFQHKLQTIDSQIQTINDKIIVIENFCYELRDQLEGEGGMDDLLMRLEGDLKQVSTDVTIGNNKVMDDVWSLLFRVDRLEKENQKESTLLQYRLSSAINKADSSLKNIKSRCIFLLLRIFDLIGIGLRFIYATVLRYPLLVFHRVFYYILLLPLSLVIPQRYMYFLLMTDKKAKASRLASEAAAMVKLRTLAKHSIANVANQRELKNKNLKLLQQNNNNNSSRDLKDEGSLSGVTGVGGSGESGEKWMNGGLKNGESGRNYKGYQSSVHPSSIVNLPSVNHLQSTQQSNQSGGRDSQSLAVNNGSQSLAVNNGSLRHRRISVALDDDEHDIDDLFEKSLFEK